MSLLEASHNVQVARGIEGMDSCPWNELSNGNTQIYVC